MFNGYTDFFFVKSMVTGPPGMPGVTAQRPVEQGYPTETEHVQIPPRMVTGHPALETDLSSKIARRVLSVVVKFVKNYLPNLYVIPHICL